MLLVLLLTSINLDKVRKLLARTSLSGERSGSQRPINKKYTSCNKDLNNAISTTLKDKLNVMHDSEKDSSNTIITLKDKLNVMHDSEKD